MQFLNLPLETFRAILEGVVCEVEYPQLIELRLVNNSLPRRSSMPPYDLRKTVLAQVPADDNDFIKLVQDVANRVMGYLNVDPAGGDGNLKQRQEIILTIARAALELEDWECSCEEKSTASKDLLSAAASLGYLPLVKHLVEQEGVDVETKSDVFGNAFLNAARKGHVEIVRFFLSKGIDWEGGDELNPRDSKEEQDAYDGYSKLWKVQIKFFVEIKQKPVAFTALELAALGGHEGVARLLLSQPSPREWRTSNNHIRSITLAAMSGNLKLLKFLDREADHSYSPIWKDVYCHSLLAAAYHGGTEVISCLLKKGAKLKYSETLEGEDTTALSEGLRLSANLGIAAGKWASVQPGLLEDAARESPVCVIRVLLEKGVHKGLDGGKAAMKTAVDYDLQEVVGLFGAYGVSLGEE